MQKLTRALIIGLTLGLMSCSLRPKHSGKSLSRKLVQTSSEIIAPDIAIYPQKAFYPLRINEDGKIMPSFQNYVCAKKLIGICTKWEKRLVFFPDLEWFYMNGFGLYKMPLIE